MHPHVCTKTHIVTQTRIQGHTQKHNPPLYRHMCTHAQIHIDMQTDTQTINWQKHMLLQRHIYMHGHAHIWTCKHRKNTYLHLYIDTVKYTHINRHTETQTQTYTHGHTYTPSTYTYRETHIHRHREARVCCIHGACLVSLSWPGLPRFSVRSSTALCFHTLWSCKGSHCWVSGLCHFS